MAIAFACTIHGSYSLGNIQDDMSSRFAMRLAHALQDATQKLQATEVEAIPVRSQHVARRDPERYPNRW